MTVLAIGEVLWDVLPTGKVVGGAPGNFAYRLTEAGVAAKLVSRIGNDESGAELRELLSARNIDLSLLQVDSNHPTGWVPVTLNEEGNPHYEIMTGVAYDFIEYTSELEAAVKNCSLVYFGTLIQRAPKSRETIAQILKESSSKTKFLDINLRKDCYSKETIELSLTHASILKLNGSEITALSKIFGTPNEPHSFAEWLFKNFPTLTLLVTLGEDGALALGRDGTEISTPGIRVNVVDTIGSGDAFSGGFVIGHLRGDSLRDCCIHANRLGAAAACTKGGMSSIPAEVWKMISNQGLNQSINP